jgi:plastocyanin
MTFTRTLTAFALGVFLSVCASAQHSEHLGVPKAGYDPEPGGGDPNAPPGCSGVTAKVTITGASAFTGGDVTVDVGDPVCWTWNDTPDQHNVKADDGSFTSGPPSASGNFQRTFRTPGTYGYHCQVHGSPTGGMRGKVIVRDAAGGEGCGEGKGSLQLDPASYAVNENGAVGISVARVDGGAGAATVRVSTVPGSAKAGKDYLPRNNVLVSWGDGDCSPKTVEVQTKNDGTAEPDESFTVKLAKATGAALGSPVNASVTIHDDDGCSAALAPASVKAAGQSGSEIRVAWSGEPAGASSLHLERRAEGGGFREVAVVPAGAGSFVDSGLPGGSTFQYRLRVEGPDGLAAYSPVAAAATDGAAGECTGGAQSLCLAEGRFEATARWRAASTEPWRGASRAELDAAPRSGAFAFAPRGDLQLVLNVVDGCSVNDRYWVQLASLSELELTVSVRDTQTGRTWVHFDPAGGEAAPIRDLDALATCP